MTLYPYQTEAIKRLETQRGLCLWANTGLGKGYLSSTILNRGDLVICPSHLIGDWQEKLTDQGKESNAILKPSHSFDKSKVNIISIQRFRLNPDPYLGFKIPLLVIDEAHRIKNYKGKGYKAVLKLIKNVQKVLLISATFLTKNNVDMFAPAFISDSKFRADFGWSFWKFAKENILFESKWVGTRTIQEPTKIIESAMEKYIRPCFYRVTYSSAGIPEPECVLQTVFVSENKRIDKRIEEIKNSIGSDAWSMDLELLQKAIDSKASWVTKAQQLVNNFEYVEESTTYYNFKEKIDLLKSIIDTEQGKGIVFYKYKAEQEQLQKELGKSALCWSGFHSIAEFENSNCSVLLCQQQAVGEGIRFKYCTYIVEFSLQFDFGLVKQGRGRLRYAGRTSPYKIFSFVLRNDFARQILSNLNRKSIESDNEGGKV